MSIVDDSQVLAFRIIKCDKLQEYHPNFMEKVYDTLGRCSRLTVDKLKGMEVTKDAHIESIMTALKELMNPSARRNEEVLCSPITLAPYKNPARAADGNVYERTAVEI